MADFEHELIELREALLGIAADISKTVKEQLDNLMKVAHEVNYQLGIIRAARTQLQQHAQLAPEEVKSKLDTINKQLIQSNKTLTGLQKELPKTLAVGMQSVPKAHQGLLKKNHDELNRQVEMALAENKKLLDDTKKLRDVKEEKPHHPTLRRGGGFK